MHKDIWGYLLLAFLGWVILASTPSERIDRGCRPISWGGSVTTSLAAMASPTYQESVQGWFNKLSYGCNYSLWRLMYQDEYNAWIAKNGGEAPAVDTSVKAAEVKAPDAKAPSAKSDKGLGL